MNVDRKLYDPDLQMFREPPREVIPNKLEAVRWRVQNEMVGARPVLGRPTGDLARELGYEDSEGKAIKTAVVSRPRPVVLSGVETSRR